MASETQEGKLIDFPIYPWSLTFKPFKKLKRLPLGLSPDYKLTLMALPPGTPLYEVYARDRPAKLGGLDVKIAEINLTSNLTTSKWGDEHLYFRHERYDTDLRMRPEWKPFVPSYAK